MKSLGDILKKKSGGVKKTSQIDEKTLLFVCNKVILNNFGEIGRGKIIPEKIIGKTLVLKIESSLWSSEVWLNREMIIREINNELDDNILEKIKI